jgi:hypothetical protein
MSTTAGDFDPQPATSARAMRSLIRRSSHATA